MKINKKQKTKKNSVNYFFCCKWLKKCDLSNNRFLLYIKYENQ